MSSNEKTTEVTVSNDLVTPHSNHSIELLIAAIRSHQYKRTCHTVHQLNAAGDKRAANEVKKYLPAATFSCQYKHRRCKENVTHYNGNILLDADNLSQSELVRLVAMLPTCPYVYAFFISPSGNGIKILVKTNGEMKHHLHTYSRVVNYFTLLLQVKFDTSTCDVVRLCFLSHDPNAYLNPDAWVYEVKMPVIARVAQPVPIYREPKQSLRYETGDCFAIARNDSSMNTTDYLFRKCVRFTNRKRQFSEGNRNNFVFLLSCYCRMNGLSREDALNEIVQHYNFSQREIQSAVRSAYRYK